MIPYGRQDINEEDIQAVVDVLRSDFITQGPKVPEFEKTLSGYCGSKYGVAVNSATSALHIACLALGLEDGDYLWTSPNTFVASANCAIYCGAKVDFVDIDSRTYNLCPIKLEEKLKEAEKANKLPKIVIPVHFAGQSCEMDKIHRLSIKYGFSIIEDASHAIGGKYKGLPIGNCKYSDITVFSFHPVKIITTAEGGMALTNDSSLNDKMRLFRSHGVTREAALMGDSHGPWYYQQVELGYNYRMTEIQAALGISQFKRLDSFIKSRHEIASYYNEKLSNIQVTVPWQHPDTYSAFHLYPLLFRNSKSRRQVFEEFREEGVGVNVHYIPVNSQPYYKVDCCPAAYEYYSYEVSIPIFPSMTSSEIDKVVSSVKKVAKN